MRTFKVLCLLFLSLLSMPTFGQSFMVKPMSINATVRAGETVQLPLEVRNTGGVDSQIVDVRLVELGQATSGTWRFFDPVESSEELPGGHSSSVAWTRLSQDEIDIAPLSPGVVMVELSPPHSARGTFVSALLVESRAPQGQQAGGLSVRVRFLVPVIVEIAARPVRQNVRLTGASLQFEPDGQSSGTMARLHIFNEGKTFSRVRGQLAVERRSGERWRPVTRLDILERSIIPGVALELGGDLSRRLPSGEYRLRGELYVDGRRVTPLEQVVEFVGDPAVDNLVYDTALIVEPKMINTEIVQGATRSTVLSVENPGEEPVRVTADVLTPRALIGNEMNGLRSIDFSAESWVSIQPGEFTIRPNGRQNIRVVSRLPVQEEALPHYYAELMLKGEYLDGQSAGESRSTIHLSNGGSEREKTSGGVIDKISLSVKEGGQYIVQTRLTNVGLSHAFPEARVYLMSHQGRQVLSQALSGQREPLMPLDTRRYSEIVDFGDVEPGYYALLAEVSDRGVGFATHQEIVRISVLKDESGELVKQVFLVDDIEEFEKSYGTLEEG